MASTALSFGNTSSHQSPDITQDVDSIDIMKPQGTFHIATYATSGIVNRSLVPFLVAKLSFENKYGDFSGRYLATIGLYDSAGNAVPELSRNAHQVEGRPDRAEHAMIFTWPSLRITESGTYQLRVELGKTSYLRTRMQIDVVGEARTGPINIISIDHMAEESSETCPTCCGSS
jgi:hypothetical protein